MDKILSAVFEAVLCIWLLNFVIDGLFDVNIVGIIVKKLKKWAGDCDDPA